MHRSVTIALKTATACLVFSGYWALTTTIDYGAGILLIPIVALAAMPLAERLHLTFPKTFQVLTQTVAFAYFILLPVTFFNLRLIDWVIALVMFIQVYALLRFKRAIEYGYLYLMAFFLLLAACTMEPEPTVGLVMLLFLISAIWAFIMLQMYVETSRTAGRIEPEILPLEEKRRTILVPGSRQYDWGLLALTGAISLTAIVLTAGFFVFTPRIEAGFLGTNPGQSTYRSGLSQEVDLARGGTIVGDSTPVMRVAFPDQPDGRYNGPMYWRATTLAGYTGSGWIRTSLIQNDTLDGTYRTPDLDYRRRGGTDVVRRRQMRPGPEVRQEIYMDGMPETGLPALSIVREVRVSGGSKAPLLRWDEYGDFTVRLAREQSGGLNYTAFSETYQPTPNELRTAPADYRTVLEHFDYGLLTHSSDLLPETVQLARRLTRDEPTVFDKAMAIQRYLSGGQFTYTLEVPPLARRNTIDHFIHTVKTGHCELYASAMALMLRSVGVPTRVVSGYRGGDWNEQDESYLITNEMAHLWVEVYFPVFGWVTFDPSPAADEQERTVAQTIASYISHYVLTSKMLWYREVVGFEGGLNLGSLRELSLDFLRGEDPETEEGTVGGGVTGTTIARILFLIALGLTALFLLYLVTRRYVASRRRERDLNDDQVRAQRLYLRLQRNLRRQGSVIEGKTAEEICNELAVTNGNTPEFLQEIFQTYSESRFGGKPLPQERYKRLREMLNAWKPA